MKKKIGILGGMGPYATVEFYKKILDLTHTKKDWDHLRLIIDSNPHIPSRSRHVLFNEDSPVQGMIESCKRLEKWPVDIIAIPCNSAAFFINQIQPSIKTPIINICEVTSCSVAFKFPAAKKAVVLGGIVTYSKKNYEYFLLKNGIEYVQHTEVLQRKVENLIEQIKQYPKPYNHAIALNVILNEIYQETKADIGILGCTEFGCLENIDGVIPTIDSSTELALHIIKIANE